MKKMTAAAQREIERLAVEQGDSYGALMERAGRSAARWLLELPDVLEGPVTVVCGRGNNGGDGFVIARHLCAHTDVTVVLAAGMPTTEDARHHLGRLEIYTRRPGREGPALTVLDWTEEPYLCSAAIRQATVLVDCIYGIGFHGALPEDILPLMEQMNAAPCCKVAIDMPSGVHADTGETAPGAFRADDTLMFIGEKAGGDAAACGQVTVLPLDIPEGILEQVLGQRDITSEMVRACFRPRPLDSHKGTFGHLLVACGSYGMAGAAFLCAKAALRSGVGLLTLAVPECIYPILAPMLPEAVFLPLPATPGGRFDPVGVERLLAAAQKATALVVGCGMGAGEEITRVVMPLLRQCRCPVILDADGINAVTPHMLVEETISAPLVLTPHPGEMARLLDTSTEEIQRHREEVARRFADEYGVTLALKGYHTLVAAPGRPALENHTGNPGMATGGSGDLLAGMIASLAAQGMDPYYAALCGVYLHGAAGDRAAARLSQHSMLPTDMLEELGGLFLNMEK